jgi:hypothetical protein
MENNHNPMEDDGSLDFLKIPADETNKHFNCPETTQQKLINLTFWVCDYIEGVKTKFGSDRTLVKIKMNRGRPRPRRTQVLHQFAGNQICPRQDSGDGQIPATGNDAGIWNAVLLGVMDV